jgi:AcrR family transcriptional regulator
MSRRPATSPRKQPSQERSRATVDALLAATARVLQRDGYDRASTNKIALAAGVSIGSLYQYFPSKEAIVAALIEREVEAQFRVVETKLAEVLDAPLPVAVRALIEAILECHRLHPKLHKVLTEEVPRVGALKRVVEVEQKTQALLRAGLELKRASLRIRDPELAAFVLVHAVEGVLHGAIQYAPRLFDEVHLVDELSELVLGYLQGQAQPR